MAQVASDPAEDVLLGLLDETGLRSAAIAHLTYATLLDEDHIARKTCKTLEKGNKWRVFLPSIALQARIQTLGAFVRGIDGVGTRWDAIYILNLHQPSKPLSNVWDIVRRLAVRAGVTNLQVHPHMFRHTLVGKLVEAGNSMDVVARFIGHGDAKTTSHFYWVPTVEDLHKQMIDPFAEGYRKRHCPEQLPASIALADAKVAACRRIIDVLLQRVSIENVREQMPEFDDILRQIDAPTDVPPDSANMHEPQPQTQDNAVEEF